MCVPPSTVIIFSLRFSKATLPRPQQRMTEAIRWLSSTSCTIPMKVHRFSSSGTLSYVNEVSSLHLSMASRATPTSPTSSFSRTYIHQSVLLNPLSSAFPVGSLLSMTSHSHIFSTVKIFFQNPPPCSTIISDHQLSSSLPFHQGILNFRQQNPL